ncbi:MAG: hypothetical protein IT461_11965 [Planctomycetes bacterium]|nr:hypothetical protein [Planctomycetota bacterium]
MTAGSPSNDVDDGVECAHALATRTILDTALELTAIVARDIMQLTRLMAQLTCAMLDLIKTTETVSTTVAAHAVGFFCNAPPHELQILSQMRNARLRANA